jgi:hypothetical protein
MVRSGSFAMGLVLALAAFAAGCAVQTGAPDEVKVDTNGHVTADGVVPMLTNEPDPCAVGINTPQPWACRPSTTGNGPRPVRGGETEFVLGYKSFTPELLEPAPTAPTPKE